MDDFVFRNVYTDNTPTKVDQVNIFYRCGDRMYNIDGPDLKKKYNWVLGWQPRIWNNLGTVPDYEKGPKWQHNVSDIGRLYVMEDKYFEPKLPKLLLAYHRDHVMNFENPYFVACCAAYLLTYMSGFSTRHLFGSKPSQPNVVTSISRYHLYYYTRKFLRTPNKLNTYMTDDQIELARKNLPHKDKWKWEFDQTKKQRLDVWLSKQPQGSVHDYYTTQSRYGGQIGIHYLRKIGSTIYSLDDYKLFVSTKSTGLTLLGQLLFQESIESFVYSVLGAKASTRWSIVDRGAMSLQTQTVFYKLVSDTVT